MVTYMPSSFYGYVMSTCYATKTGDNIMAEHKAACYRVRNDVSMCAFDTHFTHSLVWSSSQQNSETIAGCPRDETGASGQMLKTPVPTID